MQGKRRKRRKEVREGKRERGRREGGREEIPFNVLFSRCMPWTELGWYKPISGTKFRLSI